MPSWMMVFNRLDPEQVRAIIDHVTDHMDTTTAAGLHDAAVMREVLLIVANLLEGKKVIMSGNELAFEARPYEELEEEV